MSFALNILTTEDWTVKGSGIYTIYTVGTDEEDHGPPAKSEYQRIQIHFEVWWEEELT